MTENMPKRMFFILELLTLVIFLTAIFLSVIFLENYILISRILVGVLGLACLLIMFLYLPIYYINFKFIIEEDRIMLKSGVIFEKRQLLYRDKICYASVYKNPFTKIFSLSSLVIGAAGGIIIVPFIDSAKAKRFQDELCRINKV